MIKGISVEKKFIETKADVINVSATHYKVVFPKYFSFVTVTSRNGEKISIAYNATNKINLVSSSYEVFGVGKKEQLLPDFLFLIFQREEFDRYVRFNSWGTARETFSFDDMCRVKFFLPSLEEQKKIVAAWKALRAMQEQNEAMAEPLFALCRSRLQEMKNKYTRITLGGYISRSDTRNIENVYTVDAVRGVSIEKKFIKTKANMSGVSLTAYKIVSPQFFSFVTVTSRNGEKISLAYNECNETYIVSSSYEVFQVIKKEELLPDFLFLVFQQKEFDRYARFSSWGSAREVFSFDDMCRVKIPLPPLSVQKALVDVYRCAAEARRIAEEADRLSREICPALIQHAVRGGN